MGKRIARILMIVLVWTAFMSAAQASRNDFTLWRFCERDGVTGACHEDPANSQPGGNANRVIPDNKKFARFAEQLTALLGPRYHSPAETLGWSGWNLGLEFSLNQIPGGDAWDDALEGVERFGQEGKKESAPGMIHTLQFHVRKGFPFSTEFGFTGGYILGSKMFTLGFEGKVAFVEKVHKYSPDFSFRMNYKHLFGATDLDLDVFAWDLNVSYNFGLGGFVQLVPYTGYSMMLGFVRAHTVSPLVTDNPYQSENFAAYAGPLMLLDDQKPIVHRWFMGVQLWANYISFTPEIIITSAEVYTYSFNLGGQF